MKKQRENGINLKGNGQCDMKSYQLVFTYMLSCRVAEVDTASNQNFNFQAKHELQGLFCAHNIFVNLVMQKKVQ